MLKSSHSGFNFVENVEIVQKENLIDYAKIYFKNFIQKELKNSQLEHTEELNDLMDYEKKINRLYS